jgi:hypothetical protein
MEEIEGQMSIFDLLAMPSPGEGKWYKLSDEQFVRLADKVKGY